MQSLLPTVLLAALLLAHAAATPAPSTREILEDPAIAEASAVPDGYRDFANVTAVLRGWAVRPSPPPATHSPTPSTLTHVADSV